MALDGTDIATSLITTCGVLGVGIFGYLGIKAQLVKSNEQNTNQHGTVSSVVKNMDATLKSIDATISLLVTTQGFPLFKNSVDGGLIWANSSAFELLGVPFDQLMSSDIWPTLIHQDDRARVVDNWNKQVATGVQAAAINYRYVHPTTGVVTHVRGMSRAIHNADGDVTEWLSMVVPIRVEASQQTKVKKE